MTRHENHDIFARHAAARRQRDPDAEKAVFGSQKMMTIVCGGTALTWAAIIWAVL